MRCQQCDALIDQNAPVCPQCGAAAKPQDPADATTPILTVRPVFIPELQHLRNIPHQLFATVFWGGALGGLLMQGLEAAEIDFPWWPGFVFVGLLVFVGNPWYRYTRIKAKTERTEYRFYADRLEYTDGYGSGRTVPYAHISHVGTWEKSPVQYKYGLGKVKIYVSKTGPRAKSYRLEITDIENVEAVQTQILDLVGQVYDAETGTGGSSAPQGEPVLTARPVFVPKIILTMAIPLQVIMAVFGGLIIGFLGMLVRQVTGSLLPEWVAPLLGVIIGLVVSPIVEFKAKMKSYAEKEYLFYPDRLVILDKDGSTAPRTLNYQHISEVELFASGTQKKHGLGTLMLSVPKTGEVYSSDTKSHGGIQIADIEQPAEIQRQLLAWIGPPQTPPTP